ncbi:Oidioi.mRNA.OKI2018_I69.XSR.g14905.t1.cds [Oikopleura dioica]|uniref:Oidioi.mRNA.OKI2018_I69.XSR.g14905.t1.cds n=1 Tax=Oikopleura dioica TaxID=34765 RepID=A0ABN7SB47_OIKDI|nr:Oidioi.mRNA.OKI2018_I69.XSR.g14905.t1.cds [Oikopleura dioica]
MFWKSFSLSPPIESELYQPDILQRQRTATPAGRKKSSRLSRHEIQSARSLHLVQIRSYQKEVAEEEERKKNISENRLRARELLESHRKHRVYAELISSRVNRRYVREEKNNNDSEADEVQKLDFFKSKTFH